MKYTLSYNNPSTHYIDIQIEIDVAEESTIQLQLPAWRPGRYELGNFAKNIQKWSAKNESGVNLNHRKMTKDLWEINCENEKRITVNYNYFANELNAGSTYLDENQLYVNPVNCFMYLPNRMDVEMELQLQLPEDYKVAIALPEVRKNVFKAKNFDELADSPFIASKSIQHHTFTEQSTEFHLWFQGEFKPDWELLEKDFRGFTKAQIDLFGDFPTEDFHYLFQILPQSAYHGVEHSASTVIALGPSYSVLKQEGRYEDLLGISSHELFHTWNVKRIRPIEMVPYDFSKENYSKLGYLSEGATTWYGDLTLYRGRVFNDAAFFRTFNQLLDRHYNNPGSLNMSVADSSFDTWLDGYVLGVPNRKASIYTEGALITFMLDVEIRKNTKNEKSFDDVLKTFYLDFYKREKGIAEKDYKQVVDNLAGIDLTNFFDQYIYGMKDYTEQLNKSLDYFGLKMTRKPANLYHEAFLGIKLNDHKIALIYPDSPAEQAGISVNDEIFTINGIKVNDDLSPWLEYFQGSPITIATVDPFGYAKKVEVELSADIYFAQYEVSWKNNLSVEQEENRQVWRGF